jgi:RNA polymerase sigma-70 factor (ECF subfamily)
MSSSVTPPSGREIAEKLSTAYAENAEAILRHCNFRTSNPEDSEELLQDTFMRAYEYLEQGNTVDNIKAFLFRIANNLIIDRARKQKSQRENQVPLDVMQDRGHHLVTNYGNEMVQQKLEAEQVLLSLKDLKQEDRLLFMLRYFDGLTPAEIGTLTGLRTNHVSVRLHRILKSVSHTMRTGKIRARLTREMKSIRDKNTR